MGWSEILNFLLPAAMMVNPNCDFYQQLDIGQTYYIYNIEYPNLYRHGSNCRWIAQSPPFTQIVLSCHVYLPSSPNCNQDRITVSLSGNSSFNDARLYCGVGNFTLITKSNSLAMGLHAPQTSRGGRFSCTVVTIESNEINTPSTTSRPDHCDCGWRQQKRIVGGTETGVNEYPFMAGIIDLLQRMLWCGSAIISEKYALTAAHCFHNKKVKNFALLVGDHDISRGDETDSAALYILDMVVIHEEFNIDDFRNDIAIVRTRDAMALGDNVGPVCLPFRFTNKDFTGQSVTVLGWGTTSFTGELPDVLMAANLSIVDNNYCEQELPDDRITKGSLCTFTPEKDACQYDSGGPLSWFDKQTRRYQLLGLVSFGVACASSKPAVNTRVSIYLSWIVKMTNGTSFCIK